MCSTQIVSWNLMSWSKGKARFTIETRPTDSRAPPKTSDLPCSPSRHRIFPPGASTEMRWSETLGRRYHKDNIVEVA